MLSHKSIWAEVGGSQNPTSAPSSAKKIKSTDVDSVLKSGSAEVIFNPNTYKRKNNFYVKGCQTSATSAKHPQIAMQRLAEVDPLNDYSLRYFK